MTSLLPGAFRADGPYVNALNKAVDSALPSITNRVQRDASAAGWEARVASQLRARRVGTSFAIGIPDPLESDALDAEYGTQDNTPMPVLRNFESDTSWQTDLIKRGLKAAGL